MANENDGSSGHSGGTGKHPSVEGTAAEHAVEGAAAHAATDPSTTPASTGGASGVDQAVQTASQAATTAQQAGQGISDIQRMVSAIQSGDVSAALGGVTDTLGAAGGALGAAGSGNATIGSVTTGLGAVSSAIQAGQAIVHRVEDLVHAIAGDHPPVPKVVYAFDSEGDPHAHYKVVRFTHREALNELYECTLDLSNEDLHADPDLLLGKPCTFSREREGRTPFKVHGVVRQVEHQGTAGGHLLCRVVVVPALWALSQRFDSYIFQDVDTTQIVSVVLAEGLAPFQRECELKTQGTYAQREYCVQYNESDLDFVMRLLAEEGIGFCFDQTGDKEKLVLFDQNDQLAPVETLDGNPAPIAGPEAGTLHVEAVQHFDFVKSLRSTSFVVRDFDFTRPLLTLQQESRGTDGGGLDREVYQYPGPTVIGDYSAPNYAHDDNHHRAVAQREYEKSREKVGKGDGQVLGIGAGLILAIDGHHQAALDGRYVVTRVEHTGEAPEELHHDTQHSGESTERYTNRFECLPQAVPYRPKRVVRRPMIRGPQTAWVVGPDGEEIYTDVHGRIKVQFHWDREGQRNERSSCWMRVVQPWAGPGWGSWWLPRIGMEVFVTFLEGNPDRPVVTGSVYNGTNQPPYELPDKKTVSTIKSNSSPGGNGYNEFRFEDAAGSEEVYLQAQKDLNELVKHDHTTRVRNDQTNLVQGKQVEDVTKDQLLTVHHNRLKNVKGDETSVIEGPTGRTEIVNKDESLTIHGSRVEVVDHDEQVTITGMRHEEITGYVQQTMHNDRVVHIDGNDRLEIMHDRTEVSHGSSTVVTDVQHVIQQGRTTLTFVGENVSLEVPNGIQITNGKAEILISPSGAISISAKGGIQIEGPNVVITGKDAVHIGVGGSSISLAADGVTISGAAVTSSASATNTISGGVVKIN